MVTETKKKDKESPAEENPVPDVQEELSPFDKREKELKEKYKAKLVQLRTERKETEEKESKEALGSLIFDALEDFRIQVERITGKEFRTCLLHAEYSPKDGSFGITKQTVRTATLKKDAELPTKGYKLSTEEEAPEPEPTLTEKVWK